MSDKKELTVKEAIEYTKHYEYSEIRDILLTLQKIEVVKAFWDDSTLDVLWKYQEPDELELRVFNTIKETQTENDYAFTEREISDIMNVHIERVNIKLDALYYRKRLRMTVLDGDNYYA